MSSSCSPQQPITYRSSRFGLSVSSSPATMKIFAVVVLTSAVVLASGQSLDDCLQSDSISCVQKSLYRKAKEFFDEDSFELFSGVSLVKNADSRGRSSRTSKELMYEQEIDAANSVTDRQSALENFVSDEAGEFLAGRSLRVNRLSLRRLIAFTILFTTFARDTLCLGSADQLCASL